MLRLDLIDGCKIYFHEVNHQVTFLPEHNHHQTGLVVPERILLKVSTGEVRIKEYSPEFKVLTQVEDVEQHVLFGFESKEAWEESKKKAFEEARKNDPNFIKMEKAKAKREKKGLKLVKGKKK